MLSKVLSLLLFTFGTTSSFDPYSPGPFKTKYTSYSSLWNLGLSNDIDVWAPDTNEPLVSPIIYMVGGFGGLLPGIASFGFTIVQPWMLGNNPVTNYQGVWLNDVMDWVEIHLQDKLENEEIGYGLVIDHDSKFLMSHSSGGHIVVEFLKHNCRDIKGQILFSPVDGFDPYGIVDIYAITPGQYLNYEIPSLILMCGLEALPGLDGLGNLVPPCAPEEKSNMRFFNAMAGNTWLVNATDYGHCDALEQSVIDIIQLSHFCSAAPKDADRDAYRSFVSGEVVSFIDFILGDEACQTGDYIQDPTLMPVSTTVLRKDSFLTHPSHCKQTHCKWQEDPFTKP
ncbi:chlorophyllase-1 isoform X2 [Eurytemora carolleeae]|uniref:chlorophyllase-1 isoform X2 n=1 Tax=Eurytemora carolleeae TaxID=1294199 RepID=UPI000C78EE81|nr:chlorophyllase-1 isoform X2 [Eurytemora carolleeae]|eukprot:XP_023344690.1 chlorophyllase-1-like isoform X2 [Eurytemora affinis]